MKMPSPQPPPPVKVPKPVPPPVPKPVRMPLQKADPDAAKRLDKLAQQAQARQGRASTILSDKTIGTGGRQKLG